MAEYIEKQAAIDAIRKAENRAFNSFYKGLVKAHKIVADLPPTDVICPVRRGECKFWDKDKNYCHENRRIFLSHHYCAYGERRE